MSSLINLAYLISAALFIFGLKGLSHPRTAVRGNFLGACGMLLAIVVTLVKTGLVGWWIILAGVIVGGAIGLIFALKVEMTQMPEMVALFNGFGGAASTLVAGAELSRLLVGVASPALQVLVSVAASGLIGAVTFWGSLVAFGKLSGKITEKPVLLPARHFINVILAAAAIVLGVVLVLQPETIGFYWILVAVASILGILLVIPIGGADMPVVISLLNSYSGLAAAATGFVLSNNGLIIAGSLVGASGLILTSIMCKAMNRSLNNVIFGVLAPTEDTTASSDEIYAGKIKATSPEEVAMLFDGAQKVAIVPGYGLAVSQAQHIVRDLANLLESRGMQVDFGIHPVAGRMPGHMNVLLAEADVSYDKLREMDDINSDIAQFDVALVIGANDVVNPVARTDPSSPIAGMPIIDVDKARTVVVVKRSLSPGFAGIPNPLFAADNTLMMFGDGKKAMQELVSVLKEE